MDAAFVAAVTLQLDGAPPPLSPSLYAELFANRNYQRREQPGEARRLTTQRLARKRVLPHRCEGVMSRWPTDFPMRSSM
jgi:hypothetical protein